MSVSALHPHLFLAAASNTNPCSWPLLGSMSIDVLPPRAICVFVTNCLNTVFSGGFYATASPTKPRAFAGALTIYKIIVL
jgi:hypothetical protein